MQYTTLIETQELAERLDHPDWLICDCRFILSKPQEGRISYEKNHIPNAHYLDLELDLSGRKTALSGRHPLPTPDHLVKVLNQIGMTAKTQVVVYDDSFGAIAARLWWLLKWLGHEQVAVLNGGWQKWLKEKRVLTTDKPSAHLGHFQGRCRDEMWVDSEFVYANLHEIFLMDVRAEERFYGRIEPFDKIPGHIPGAYNIPFEDNLALDGCYLSQSELKEIYGEIASDPHQNNVVVMCGSGVTACHTLLALQHIGINHAKLYAGSWSEWITVADRPMENYLDQRKE